MDSARRSDTSRPIPASAGIGLRGPHQAEVLTGEHEIAWLEVHTENYLAEGGIAFETLRRIRERYPISLHGVGLSLGTADSIDRQHLERIKRLADAIEPGLVSEHLSWGAVGGRHSNDLLPLPFTAEALRKACENIDAVQTALGREILIENVSAYLQYRDSEMPEWEFLVETAARSGAGILLDVNNVYVNAVNHGFPARRYIDTIPPGLVAEIHLAGHSTQRFDGYEILVDTHDGPVCTAVWGLFDHALDHFGCKPTLIEWDADLPPLDRLLDEAASAQARMDRVRVRAA